MHQYISGKIVAIDTITQMVKLFYWQPDNDELYDFVPGQFSIIRFPEIKDTMPYRSYSIAGIKNNCVEFCVSHKEGGKATNLLWSKTVGDSLEITEAKGDFVLKEPLGKEICFIATGTGIAPFKPMIADLLLLEDPPEIYLVYGNRTKDDIIYHQYWQELANQYPNFNYIPVLSREKWDQDTGYVHPIYQNLFNDGRTAQFYLCGWDEMLKEARRNLKSLGYNRKQYFIESYN
jgi:ferredoxin-NADP reductase